MLHGTICFNGFTCRESYCRAWDVEREECVFILAARNGLPDLPPKPVSVETVIQTPKITVKKMK